MADNVKDLLAKWSIDNSAWKTATDEVRNILKQADADDKARQASNASAAKAALDAIKQQTAAQAALKAAAAQVTAEQKAQAQVEKDKQAAIAAERSAQEKLGSDIISIMRRTAAEAKATAATQVKAQKEIEAAAKAAARVQSQSSGGHTGVSNLQATRGSVSTLAGRGGIRPLETLISSIPAAASLAQLAFPIVGLGMFVDLLVKGVEGFNNMRKAAADFQDNLKDTFTTAVAEGQKSNDELQKSNDVLANTIAKLEHKPVNNLALALDDARIKADELTLSAIKGYDAIKKLLSESDESLLSRIMNNSSGSAGINSTLDVNARDIKNSELALDQAKRNPTDTAKIKTAQDALDKARQKQLAYTKSGAAASGIAPSDIMNSVLGMLGLSGITSPVNTETNQQKLNTVGAITQQGIDKDQLTDTNEQETNKAKQLEEAKRQNELALKDAQALLDEKKRINAEELEDAKSQTAQLSELNEQTYKSGTEDVTTYYQNKKALADQDYAETVKSINANRQAQLQELGYQTELSAVARNAKAGGINSTANRSISAAGDVRDKTQSAADIGLSSAQGDEAKKQIDAITDTEQKALQLREQQTQEAFKNQTMSAEEYTATSIQLIQRELEATESAVQQKIAINGEYSKDNIALLEQQSKAIDDAQAKIDKLQEGALALNVQGSTNNYQNRNSLLSSQLTASQNPNGGGSPSQQLSIMQQQRDLTLQYAAAQQQLLTDPALDKYSTTWFTINENILKAQQSVIALDQEIQKAGNLNSIIGSTLGAGSSAAGTIFTSRYAKGVESAITGGSNSATAANGQVSSMIKGFGSLGSSNDPSDIVSSFTTGLKGAVGALGSFVSSINSAGSASAGAFGGAISGAGLGNSAGAALDNSSLTSSDGPLSSLSGMAGPLGSLIGASLGTAVGAIFGQKQEEVQDDINTLTANFKSVMDAYSSNNASLNQTVQNLQSLIAQATADEESTKKGGSQFKDLITQYNTEITQLESQQAQVMAQLQDQLIQISSPEAYQPLIGSIQEILQQYTTFVGAAQNATQLAQANDYLTTSLQNLAESYTETLQQDQENAIQEALQLNQLYDQRNQLEQQYLQQVQSIQGQGTLTRGVTQAQSKFSQLYNLDVNQSNQLDSINQQIALTQYQVTAAQQVFQLATTKAGLESQLLGLQEQGINLDMSRIAAMQNVLQVLQQTGYSLTNLAGVDTSDPNALLTLLLQLLASQLGVTPGGANSGPSSSFGNSLLDSQTASAYDVRSSYGYANFRGADL